MQILSTIPTKDAANVALNNSISIEFDASVDTATVDESSITVSTDKTSLVSVENGLPQPGGPFSDDDFFSDGYTAIVDGSISVADDTLIFTPSSKYQTDTKYRVTISSAISDTEGNPLDKIYFFEFTTASEDLEVEELPDLAKDAVTLIGHTVNIDKETKTGFYLEETFPVKDSFLMINGEIELDFSEEVDSNTLDGIKVYKSELFSDYPPSLLTKDTDYTISSSSNSISISLIEEANIDNSIYLIQITPGLKNSEGTAFPEKYSFSYIGKLSPYHSSTKLLKLKAGTVLGNIADVNLALNIHYASLEANELLSRVTIDKTVRDILTKKYTLYTALENCLRNNYSFGLNDFIKKQLGDFSVSVSTKSKIDLYNSLIKEAKDFKRIFNEYLNFAASAGYFTKGAGSSDIGRMWDRGKRYPGLNTKVETVDDKWKLIWTPIYQGV